MTLENQIYIRKSCRKYLDAKIDENIIHNYMKSVKALNPDFDYYYKIFTSDEISKRTRWSAPYYLAIFSEIKENYLENVGFVFQQLSLYLQSQNIGSCWVGMASIKQNNSDFIIPISFGKSEDMTRNKDDFKRKSLDEISDFADERLIPAQFAPSAINSQPWYFKHNSNGFDVYQVKQNILKRKILEKWNHIDVGIALAHLYVSNKDTFEYYKNDDAEKIKGYTYSCSIKI